MIEASQLTYQYPGAVPIEFPDFKVEPGPASVISLYLKRSKRYKVDDFKKFKGTLHLNADDPTEFYYILRDAKEV